MELSAKVISSSQVSFLVPSCLQSFPPICSACNFPPTVTDQSHMYKTLADTQRLGDGTWLKSTLPWGCASCIRHCSLFLPGSHRKPAGVCSRPLQLYQALVSRSMWSWNEYNYGHCNFPLQNPSLWRVLPNVRLVLSICILLISSGLTGWCTESKCHPSLIWSGIDSQYKVLPNVKSFNLG